MPLIRIKSKALRWALIIGITLAVFLIIGTLVDLAGIEQR